MFSGLCAPLACIAGVERGREEGIKGREIEAFLTPRLPLPFRPATQATPFSPSRHSLYVSERQVQANLVFD